jgi:hypothetical protein
MKRDVIDRRRQVSQSRRKELGWILQNALGAILWHPSFVSRHRKQTPQNAGKVDMDSLLAPAGPWLLRVGQIRIQNKKIRKKGK